MQLKSNLSALRSSLMSTEKLAVFGMYVYALGSHAGRSLISFGVGFLLLAWLIDLIKNRDFDFNRPLPYWPFLALMLLMFFSPSSPLIALGTGTFYSIAFPLAIANEIKTKKTIYRIIGLTLFVLTVSAIIANYEFLILGSNRPQGMARFNLTKGNVTAMGVGLLLPLLFVKGKTILFKIAVSLSLLLNVTALAFSHARGAYLAFLGVVGCFTLIKKPKMIPLILVGLMIFFLILPVGVQDEFMSIIYEWQDEVRIDMWRSSVDMMRDYPLRGVGFENFGTYYPDYIYEEGQDTRSSPHNSYFNLATELGIPAGAIFIYLNFLLLRNFYKTSRRKISEDGFDSAIFLGIMLALVAFLIAGLFENNITESQTRNFYWALIGLGFALQGVYIKKDSMSI